MTAETADSSPGFMHTCAAGVPDADHPLRTDSEHCGACNPGQPGTSAVLAAAALAPVIAGTFAIYHRTDGGMELVTDVQGRGVESRTVPAAIIKMVASGKGPVAGLLGRMFGS